MRYLALLFGVLAFSIPVRAWQGGSLVNHNHTSTPGDGGTLSGLVVGSGLKVSSGNVTLDGVGGGTITAVAVVVTTITFPDGTSQTSAPSSIQNATNTWTGGNSYVGVSTFTGIVYGTVSRSSFTFIPAQTFTGKTAYGTCYSTVTYTVQGGAPLLIVFNGTVEETANTGGAGVSFLVDGAFVDGLGLQTGVTGHYTTVNSGGDQNMSFTYPIPAGVVSTGSHNFCLTVASATAVSTAINCSQAPNTSVQGCVEKFGVIELR